MFWREKARVWTVHRVRVLFEVEEDGFANARRCLDDLSLTGGAERYAVRLQRHGEVFDLDASEHALR